MEIEYNKIILNISRKPSDKCILVAIPMKMYRVETHEFSHGLNFFQKIVLKFKSKPGITDSDIASYVGLDPKLIAVVTSELKAHRSGVLINEYGSLTERGHEKLSQIDGLVVDSLKKKIGYVLQYSNQDKLYPYYVNQLIPADIVEESTSYTKVITGTKGDGDYYTEPLFYLEELAKDKTVRPGPTEREVWQAIKNSNAKVSLQNNEETDNSQIEKETKDLAVSILNIQPQRIWACTYVYLYQNEDDSYESDWRVLDPFGFGDNTALKFYLGTKDNKRLLESIDNKFGDAKVMNGKKRSEYQEHLNKLTEDRLSDFSLIGFGSMDANLQMYIRSIVKNFIIQQSENFNDLDSSASFSLSLQNALENILKQDREKRKSFYDQVIENMDSDPNIKRKSLIEIYRQKLFSNDTQVPQPLINSAKGSLSRGSSLLSYLTSFILTYQYDNKSKLFRLFKNRIEGIIEIAQLRNEKGHGQTSSEKALKPLTKAQVEKLYDFIKDLINEYI